MFSVVSLDLLMVQGGSAPLAGLIKNEHHSSVVRAAESTRYHTEDGSVVRDCNGSTDSFSKS